MSKVSEHRIYQFEDFRLDAAHSMLYRNAREVPLPPKAVETLLALVARKGEILSKDELMDTVWAGSIVEESNLSQYLHLLRKTLGETRDGRPFIQTLRRRGYRFVADVCLAEAPPTAAEGQILAGLDSGLEIPVSRLIGREREIADVAELLMREDVRLLTLTGVGGVGKTTLAQIVGHHVRDDFPDGVHFVELAAVTSPEIVPSTISSVLGVKEAGGKQILEILKDYLRERKMLLIVDNFEQVISAAGDIKELLAATQNLKIIITSRVLLHLSAEHEYVVPPLDAPPQKLLGQPISSCDEENRPSIDELWAYEAVRLFVVRARHTKPTFALTNDNAASVAAICARLDGLPLAIELAAARLKLMSPSTILDRLQNQLRILSGGASDLPVRQQTMRRTVEWSYYLLEETEKRLFSRLSVFAGSFSIEAAEAVCSDFDLSETGTVEVLDLITSLVDKSLLVAKEQPGGDVRFRMLEVVREYALESLETLGEREMMCRRHAEYFCALGNAAEPHLQAAQSAEWLNRLEEEHDNLRATLRWAEAFDAGLGQQLAGSIWRFWWLHGHIMEGCEQLGTFLSGELADNEARVKMLMGAAALNRLSGSFELSRSYAEESLALAQELSDKKSAALSLHQLAFLELDNEDLDNAQRLIEEGLTFAKDLGDKQVLALLYNGLGEISRLREDYASAADFYMQALQFNRQAGDRVRQTTNLINLGGTALSQGDVEAAASFYWDGLKISSGMEDTNGRLYCLEGVAGAYWAARDPERAALILGAAEASREINHLLLEPADRLPYDQSVALVRNSLTEKTFVDLFAKGRKLDLAKAVEMALADE